MTNSNFKHFNLNYSFTDSKYCHNCLVATILSVSPAVNLVVTDHELGGAARRHKFSFRSIYIVHLLTWHI